jgi:hypothetical protein
MIKILVTIFDNNVQVYSRLHHILESSRKQERITARKTAFWELRKTTPRPERMTVKTRVLI